ncbi:sugar ABC transporter permease [Pseudonocardia sp. MCCB 268]|nr:sugar ABC transporter permease [Pseudonocardia cytotoxica]
MVNTGWYVLEDCCRSRSPSRWRSPALPAGSAVAHTPCTRRWCSIPILITPVATAAVWRWMPDPGRPRQPRCSGSSAPIPATGSATWTALVTIILITGWQITGFAVLVFAAGLAASTAVRQAAALGGASAGGSGDDHCRCSRRPCCS